MLKFKDSQEHESGQEAGLAAHVWHPREVGERRHGLTLLAHVNGTQLGC